MNTSYPNLVILAVYKSKTDEGLWKGFCAPYGVTSQAETCEVAQKNLGELVALYEEGLKQYGYPSHLVYKELYDKEDIEVFAALWPQVIKEVKSPKKEHSFVDFVKKRTEGSVRVNNTYASYYQPQFA